MFVFLVVAIGILAVDKEALSTVIDVMLEIVVAGNSIECDSNPHIQSLMFINKNTFKP